MIDNRIQRVNLILSSAISGKPSPLATHEDYFMDVIIKMSRFRHSISSEEGLHLINSLIKNAAIE